MVSRTAILLAFENTASDTVEREKKKESKKSIPYKRYIFKIRLSFHKSSVHLDICCCYGLTTLVLQTALTGLSFRGCQYCFFISFWFVFPQTETERALLFYEVAATRAAIHSPSNHADLQLPALNLPACYSLHLGRTEPKPPAHSLPNSDRRGVHGKWEKGNSTNSHRLIQ